MTDLPDVKLKAVPVFPGNIIGGVGIEATKDHGSVTIDMDWNEFGLQSAIPTSPTSNVLTFDTATEQYVMIPSSLLGGAVAGISDAPNDGVQYGRQSAAWTPIAGGQFLQSGAGAVPITLNSVFKDHIFTPEMFGAVAVPMYSLVSSVNDCSAAINAAIAAVKARGGGTVLFGPGIYGVGDLSIAVDFNNIRLVGQGSRTTMLLHKPTAPATCVIFSGSGILSNVSIEGMAIASNDVSVNKVALNFSDCSYFMARDISVSFYPIGGYLGISNTSVTVGMSPPPKVFTTLQSGLPINGMRVRVTSSGNTNIWMEGLAAYTGTTLTLTVDTLSGSGTFASWYIGATGGGPEYRGPGDFGVGLGITGREMGYIEDCSFIANNPVVLDVNPHLANAIADSFNFHNLFLQTFNPNNSLITLRSGGAIGNINFTGSQNWIGGKHGFYWNSPFSSIISEGLYFSNVKIEQGKDINNGYCFYVDAEATLYNLKIDGFSSTDRQGIFLRNVTNAVVINAYYNPGGAGNTNKIGLDVDNTCKSVEFHSCSFLTGTLANTTAMTLVRSDGGHSSHSTAIPFNGTLVATASMTGSPSSVTQVAGNNSTAIATTAFVVGAVREKLTANRIYYVAATGGSNANPGTIGSPFATIQKAIDTFVTLDLNGFTGTIQLQGTTPATFTAGASVGTPFLGGTVTLLGDNVTPSNFVLNTSGANGITVNGAGCVLNVSGIKFLTTVSALYSANYGRLAIVGRVEWGACGYCMRVDGGTIVNSANAGGTAPHCWITGNNTAFIRADMNGRVVQNLCTIDIPAGTTTSTWLTAASGAAIECQGNVWTVANVTGTKFVCTTSGGIITGGGGTASIPGTVAGTATAPGWFL